MSDTLSLTTPVTVAGGGSWGTALAHLLAARGLSVTLWLRDAEVARAVNERHENPRYLPGFALDARLAASTDPAVLNRDLLVLAVPSQQLRGWLGTHRTFFRPGPVLVNAAKGLETGSLATCGAVVAEALAGLEPCGVLCELTNEDGSMARLPQVAAFASAHAMPLLSVEDIASWRQAPAGGKARPAGRVA